MIYWKGDKFWVGKLLEHPEIMTQGKTLKELQANIKDACILWLWNNQVWECHACTYRQPA
jgi:predicted RNase H-like HicB family nuclease